MLENWVQPSLQSPKDFTYDPSMRLRTADAHNLSDLKVIYEDDPYMHENIGHTTNKPNSVITSYIC